MSLKTLFIFKTVFIVFCILYVIFSFVTKELNPLNWEEGARTLFAVGGTIFSVITIAIHFDK